MTAADHPADPRSPITILTRAGQATATAIPIRAAGDQLVCKVHGEADGISHRLVRRAECANEEDRERWIIAWRALGGTAMGLGYQNDAGEWVSYEPG